MAVITTSYTNVADLIERNLKSMIVQDLRKRLLEVATKEIDDIIEQVAGDIVTKVHELRSWELNGLTLQIAINGVRKDVQ